MTIVIIGAMDVEIEKLIETLNLKNDNNNNDIFVNTDNNKKIIVSKSGIGKVNSAANTQYLIDTYKPDFIINTGCAGSLIDDLKVMDIIISSYVTYHDFTPIRIMQGSTPDNGNIKADDNLINLTKNILENEKINYYIKPIASGDLTKAYAVDMESASIGHISRKNNVPFVCIRTISDFADGNDYFEKEASFKSAKIVKKIIDNL